MDTPAVTSGITMARIPPPLFSFSFCWFVFKYCKRIINGRRKMAAPFPCANNSPMGLGFCLVSFDSYLFLTRLTLRLARHRHIVGNGNTPKNQTKGKKIHPIWHLGLHCFVLFPSLVLLFFLPSHGLPSPPNKTTYKQIPVFRGAWSGRDLWGRMIRDTKTQTRHIIQGWAVVVKANSHTEATDQYKHHRRGQSRWEKLKNTNKPTKTTSPPKKRSISKATSPSLLAPVASE